MKRLLMIMAMITVITVSAAAMTYSEARKQALYLTDKFTYELNLTDAQADAVYEINLDYFMNIASSSDLYGQYWSRRNSDLKYVLSTAQYKLYIAASYFYRPVYWLNNKFGFSIYKKYTNSDKFYCDKPDSYSTYKGGNNKKSSTYYKGRDYTAKKTTKSNKNNNSSQTWRNSQSNDKIVNDNKAVEKKTTETKNTKKNNNSSTKKVTTTKKNNNKKGDNATKEDFVDKKDNNNKKNSKNKNVRYDD